MSVQRKSSPDRLLWHQVDLVIDPDIDGEEVRAWLARPARLIPRAGGVVICISVRRDPFAGVLCRSSGVALAYVESLARGREEQAVEVEGTATAQYHRDCAMRYRALACVIRARAHRLWPAEAA